MCWVGPWCYYRGGPQDKPMARAALDGKSLGLGCPVLREGRGHQENPALGRPHPSLLHTPGSLPQV